MEHQNGSSGVPGRMQRTAIEIHPVLGRIGEAAARKTVQFIISFQAPMVNVQLIKLRKQTIFVVEVFIQAGDRGPGAEFVTELIRVPGFEIGALLQGDGPARISVMNTTAEMAARVARNFRSPRIFRRILNILSDVRRQKERRRALLRLHELKAAPGRSHVNRLTAAAYDMRHASQ